MKSVPTRIIALAGLSVAGLMARAPTAQAVPSFAAQTGQPCTACHVGAFGPQLTPFGRAFKIGGYTQQGGDGLVAKIPLSAMVLGSFNRTSAGYPQGGQPAYFDTNNNAAVDQISIFLAGRITDWAGGFVQTTYSGISRTYHLDQIDIRPFTQSYDAFGSDLRVGFTVNNNPTVQDPFNSTFAWGFPYVFSSIAPQPAGLPLLVGGLSNNSIGMTAYTWYDRSLYLEAGAYTSLSSYAVARLGTGYGPGALPGFAPYLRAAYEWNWNGQSAHVGALFMSADVNPTLTPTVSTGIGGQDRYTDVGVDAGYQFYGDGTHTLSAFAIYVHEARQLNATNGGNIGASSNVDHLRIETSYWYKNTYGLTLGYQGIWGNAAPAVFTATPIGGSANGKPNTNAFLIEADWVPFGKSDSVAAPFMNLKLGIQYVAYTMFNGASRNYDGFGRNASDNNTLYVFAWMGF
jgi:hypothetical protein